MAKKRKHILRMDVTVEYSYAVRLHFILLNGTIKNVFNFRFQTLVVVCQMWWKEEGGNEIVEKDLDHEIWTTCRS